MGIASKIRSLIADFFRVGSRYLLDGGQRNRFREILKRDGLTPNQHEIVAADIAAAPLDARPYAGLATTSLTLAGIRMSDDSEPCLNLLIGEVREGGVFAGIHTALTVGKRLAERLSLPVRVVMLDFTSAGNNAARAAHFVEKTFGIVGVTVVPREKIRDVEFGSRDVWLATHWKTAHAVQVASDIGLLDANRVAYLVQDYEPGFSPWSSESVTAAATYHAGFVPIVNSIPLWRFLCQQENLEIDRRLVFAPSFENQKLRETAAARKPSTTVTVLFYGRPSKHRNLYQLGIAALRATAVALPSGDSTVVKFYSAGEPHDEIDLGGGHTLKSLGRLAWDDYFRFLASTQVLLSLQQSPHPSHPPFDAAISGAVAVTNDFFDTRADLHPRILSVPADPVSLSGALTTAILASSSSEPGEYLPVANGLLGGPLTDAIEAAVARLTTPAGHSTSGP